jgi:hypothetical protein
LVIPAQHYLDTDIYLFVPFFHGGRLMAMEVPVFCRPAMQVKLPAAALINNSLTKSGQLGTALFGAISKYRNISRFISLISQTSTKNIGPCCSFSSSSDGNGYMAGNSSESDEDYVNSTVLEAGNSSHKMVCFYMENATQHSSFT